MHAMLYWWWLVLIPTLASSPGPGTNLPPLQGSGEWTTWTVDDGLPENEVRSLFRDSQGQLWFGTRNAGIGVFDGKSWSYHTEDDGLGSNGVLSINEDRRGRMWAAGGGGYSIFEAGRWTAYDSLGALRPRVVYSVNMDWQGHLWLGANGGASGFDGEAWQHFTPVDGLPHQVVHGALRDRDESVWFACREGLAQWTDQELVVHYPEDNFGSILEGSSGHLWFGTRSSGAFHYDGSTWVQHLDGLDLRPEFVDSDGTIWALTDAGGVYSYNGNEWTQFESADGLASDTVFSVTQAADGSMWFGTDQGVSRYTR